MVELSQTPRPASLTLLRSCINCDSSFKASSRSCINSSRSRSRVPINLGFRLDFSRVVSRGRCCFKEQPPLMVTACTALASTVPRPRFHVAIRPGTPARRSLPVERARSIALFDRYYVYAATRSSSPKTPLAAVARQDRRSSRLQALGSVGRSPTPDESLEVAVASAAGINSSMGSGSPALSPDVALACCWRVAFRGERPAAGEALI